MLIRIDDVVSGHKKKDKKNGGVTTTTDTAETFGDNRDGWLYFIKNLQFI